MGSRSDDLETLIDVVYTPQMIKDELLDSLNRLYHTYGESNNAWLISEQYLGILKDACVCVKPYDGCRVHICGKPAYVVNEPGVLKAVIMEVE